jgi:hypothetical protein
MPDADSGWHKTEGICFCLRGHNKCTSVHFMPFGYPKFVPSPGTLLRRRLRHPAHCRYFAMPDDSMSAAGATRDSLLVVCTASPRAPNSVVLAKRESVLIVRRLVMRKSVALLVSEPEEDEPEVIALADPSVEVLAVVVELSDLPPGKCGLRPWKE